MKHFFTPRFLALPLLLSVSMFSCKDKEEETVTPTNAAACQLTQVENTEADSPGEKSVTVAEYSSQGFITKLTEKYYENGVADGEAVITFEYNASNQLIKQVYSEDGQSDGYQTYTYNANGTVNKMTFFEPDGTEQSSETYTYDANKRVTESVYSYGGDSNYRTVYEYGSNDNISRTVGYFGDQISSVTTYENYDDKLNPVHSVKGMVVVGESKHNPGKVTDRYDANGDGVINDSDEAEVITYTYQYNASGYPTKMVEKNNGVEDETTTFTFTGCQ